MNNTERYEALYNFVKKNEEENECPWFVRGAWFNTAPDKYIDMETPTGGTVTNDIEEIEELLAESGLVLNFEGNIPSITWREGGINIISEETEYINFGPEKTWDTATTEKIVAQVQKYAEQNGLKNAAIKSIEDSTWSDPDNQRFDVWIAYGGEYGLIQQKLLFLKGELLDGAEFHKRIEEFYPRT